MREDDQHEVGRRHLQVREEVSNSPHFSGGSPDLPLRPSRIVARIPPRRLPTEFSGVPMKRFFPLSLLAGATFVCLTAGAGQAAVSPVRGRRLGVRARPLSSAGGHPSVIAAVGGGTITAIAATGGDECHCRIVFSYPPPQLVQYAHVLHPFYVAGAPVTPGERKPRCPSRACCRSGSCERRATRRWPQRD